MSSRMDLMDLARHLRQESLFVSSERQNLQHLNEKVVKAAERLYHLSWITRQQRLTLDTLLFSHADNHLVACYQKANVVENVNFVDSYKKLGINDSLYIEFLQQLRESPKLLAACLNSGEKININTMHNIVNIILSAVYGNCVMPEDEIHALFLLKELMFLQLAVSDNPRRLLRHGSCAFSRVYKIFSECLFSAKIFLTAALHEPIMNLLMHDDLFLDIDPSKAAVRFHPPERLRHFGKEGTPEYAAKLQEYRNWTINQLVNFTNRFIEEIRNNLYCFPQSLSWLARQLYNTIMKAKRVEVREVGAMCADLVFAFFICPAIVDPESFGITDIPISYIARFNLMQVAQILQVLAMSKWEEIDPKLMDLYGSFEKDCMSSFLDLILEGSPSDSPVDLVNQFQDLNRSAILITESELFSLVSFLRSVDTETHDEVLKKNLGSMLHHLPSSNNGTHALQNGVGNSSFHPVDDHPHTPSSKRSFLGKVGRKSSKLSNTFMHNSENHLDEGNCLQEVESASPIKPQLEDVLVVPILGVDFECPGMLSEEKVLAIESQKKFQSLENGSLVGEENGSFNIGPEMVEKRTRFSLSQDQESVGTSDNLEAISEAASNHSFVSSLDLENDNLSDMVSANVSGRGTPNVSGRDTPSSQLEGEEREQQLLDLMPPARKQNQDDIQEKFGKFEIHPMTEGDETKSMVSDTWSTDVLASDSETTEQLDVVPQDNLEVQSCLERALLDASETASQSDAWSTDVVTSDTERLQDIDTDDTASVARSDDTARSEADGEILLIRDGTGMNRKAFVEDPFQPSGYSCLADSSVFAPQSASGNVMDAQAKLSDSSATNEDRAENAQGAGQFRVPDLLCMDMETSYDVPSLLNGPGPSLRNESLSSMQSLGRVSLAVREMPDADNLESGPMLLDSLQETVQQNADTPHRSSIVDILSLDLTRTLNLPVAPTEEPLKKSESGSSLMDFERELFGDSAPAGSDASWGSSHHAERGAKRKLQDLGPVEDVCPQLRAVSLSNSYGNSDVGNQQSAAGLVDLGEHSEMLQSRYVKASSVPGSVGAIPKTVLLNKNSKSMEQDINEKNVDKHRKSLFKLSGFRFTFKGRSRKSYFSLKPGSDKDDSANDERPGGRHPSSSFSELRALQMEAGDEILAKYRKKPSSSVHGNSSSNFEDPSSCLTDTMLVDTRSEDLSVERASAFDDAKRKLRLVLGSADLQTLPWAPRGGRPSSSAALRLQENDLVAFLKVLLAESINLQQRPLMAHLHEALRCVRLFDDLGCQKLFKSLRSDYRKRAPYIAYLVRCRQGLLSTLSHLETLVERIERDKHVCNQYLVMTGVKFFLEKHDRYLQRFIGKFQDLVVADEKANLVEKFLDLLFNYMDSDPLWQAANELQVEQARAVVEHFVMSRIYTSALHPNGDVDVLRDKILHEHMQKLSHMVTPNHEALRISKIYHSECPWPSAQAELFNINAYKTPRDKIQCVLRACGTIMNLLAMASDRSVPAADDLVPVLVFVLIKANPPHLLSTVQYVNTFYEKQLEGEEAYWWTQFASCVEFIKNMG